MGEEISSGPTGQYFKEETRKDQEQAKEAGAIALRAKLEKSEEAKKKLDDQMKNLSVLSN